MTNEEVKALIRDYKRTFGTDAGKRVYKDLMKKFLTNDTAHNVDNANHTFVMAGLREAGLYIKKNFEWDFRKDKKSVKQETKEPIET